MNPKYLVKCTTCSRHTNRAYARAHQGQCKTCVAGTLPLAERHSVSAKPTRDERILDHGYQAYAREEGHHDNGE